MLFKHKNDWQFTVSGMSLYPYRIISSLSSRDGKAGKSGMWQKSVEKIMEKIIAFQSEEVTISVVYKKYSHKFSSLRYLNIFTFVIFILEILRPNLWNQA